MKRNVLSHLRFPPGKETVPPFPGKQFPQGKDTPGRETDPPLPGNQFLQGKKNFTLESNLKPFVDKETVPSTLGTSLNPFVNTCTLTLTFTMETNPEWKSKNSNS